MPHTSLVSVDKRRVMTLLAMAVSHGLFVMLVPWPQQYHGAGIVFAPLVILDMYAWARLLLAMVRLYSV